MAFILSAVPCFLLNYFEEIYLTIISYTIFLTSAVCVGFVMGIAVNMFPTNYRSTASSFIFTFIGRIGAATGSFLVALLLENYCTSIFYIFGGALISMKFIQFITFIFY